MNLYRLKGLCLWILCTSRAYPRDCAFFRPAHAHLPECHCSHLFWPTECTFQDHISERYSAFASQYSEPVTDLALTIVMFFLGIIDRFAMPSNQLLTFFQTRFAPQNFEISQGLH